MRPQEKLLRDCAKRTPVYKENIIWEASVFIGFVFVVVFGFSFI